MVYKMKQKEREKGKMKQTEETSHSNATHETRLDFSLEKVVIKDIFG